MLTNTYNINILGEFVMRVILGALSKILAGEFLIDKNPLTLIQELDLKGQKIEEDFSQLLKIHFCKQPSNRKYIERVDEQAFNQPYSIKGTDMYGFVMKAEYDSLQKLCDKYFNIGSSKFYCPAASCVVLTLNNIESLQSINPPDSEKGRVSEQEAIFWVPIFMGTKIGTFFKPEKLVWFMSYLFVDNTPPLVSGREIYGFPKQLAKFTFPSPLEKADFLSVDTLVFKKFSPDSTAQEARIIEVKTEKSLNQSNKYQDFSEFLADIVKNIQIKQITIPNFDIGFNLISSLLEEKVNVISLKEFRDVEDPTIACYKAIVHSSMVVTQFHQAEISTDSLVSIFNYPSHQICQELGLSASNSDKVTITPLFSFHLNFDFQLNGGTVLWEEEKQKK